MDCEAAEKLIDHVYQAGMQACAWDQLMEDVATELRADGAWIVFANPDLEHFEVVSPRSNPAIVRDFQQFWWRHDPTSAVTSKAPIGQITTLANTGPKRFLHSQFHNEFWRYSGQPAERVAVNLFVQGTSRISFGVQPQKSNEDLDSEFIGRINPLLPHLCRAAEIHYTLRRLEIQNRISESTHADSVLIVDHEARPVLADDETLAFFKQQPGIRLRKGQVSFAESNLQSRFRRLLSSCGQVDIKQPQGGNIVVRDNVGRALVEVEVLPWRAAGMCFPNELTLIPTNARLLAITDLANIRRNARDMLAKRYALTPAEAGIALELMRGDTRTDVADRLGVKLSTVRTHMMHLFEKVGVNSRAELLSHLVQAGVDRKIFS